MNSQTLLKISLAVSIIGILMLLFISNNLQPSVSSIKDITDFQLNKKVQIKGRIININNKNPSFQLMTLQDKTGKITITLDKNIEFSQNQTLIVIGRITEYKNLLQIQSEKIFLVSEQD